VEMSRNDWRGRSGAGSGDCPFTGHEKTVRRRTEAVEIRRPSGCLAKGRASRDPLHVPQKVCLGEMQGLVRGVVGVDPRHVRAEDPPDLRGVRRRGCRMSLKSGPALGEDPGVPPRGAADHDAMAARFPSHGQDIRNLPDVSVPDDGKGGGFPELRNEGPPRRAAVSLRTGAGVKRDGVHPALDRKSVV